jgi:lycopene beta-cyclase
MSVGEHIYLIGGGLQSALIALALDASDVDVQVTLIERSSRLGGNHTWCFFESDLSADARRFTSPLVTHHWDGYEVQFPGLVRSLQTGYRRVDAERLHTVVAELFDRRDGWTLLLGTSVDIAGSRVTFPDGRTEAFDLCVMSTGPVESEEARGAGYQKFVGAEVLLERTHGLERPVLMDATVAQEDGLRFFYLLPLDDHRLLVEDTRFSDNPRLNIPEVLSQVDAYLCERGLGPATHERVESGVLPMPWDLSGEVEPAPSSLTGGTVIRGGYAGGWFHPGTGYSLPVAARLAEAIASGDARRVQDLRARTAATQRVARGLNRVLFRHYDPANRWRLIQRFYRRPLAVIERFYSLELTWVDLVRVVVGRIPKQLRWLPRPTTPPGPRLLPSPSSLLKRS